MGSPMTNPIVLALVPHVADANKRPLMLDTYGPSSRPDGIAVLSKLVDGTEVLISRHAISSSGKSEFASWFAEATEWLDRRMKEKGL